MKKLRIAYLTPRYYPYLGGVEYVVRNLAEGLALKGHNITVFAGDPHVKEIMKESVNGVKIVRVPTYVFREAYHVPKDKQNIKQLLQESFDVVHTNSIHAVFTLLPFDIKKSDKPDWKLVMTMHHSTEGYTLLSRLIWKLFWKRYVSRRMRYADLVHVTSSVESDIVSEHFPSIKDKILPISLGLEDDVLNYSWKGKDSDYLLYCGRLEKYKRVDLIVKAVAYLSERGYNTRLVVVGSGSMRKKIAKLSEEQSDYVTYLSPQPRKEYLKLISNARAAISLSSAENFNLFLAEAYTIGVPIIATREAASFYPQIGTVTDLSASHVAQEILNVVSNGNQNCSEEYAPKPWSKVIDRFEDVYKDLL